MGAIVLLVADKLLMVAIVNSWIFGLVCFQVGSTAHVLSLLMRIISKGDKQVSTCPSTVGRPWIATTVTGVISNYMSCTSDDY